METHLTSENLKIQLEQLTASIVNYFNNEKPFIFNINDEKKQILVIYNSGETWEQVEEISKSQNAGEFILQKPLITLKSTGLEPISERNRLPNHYIELSREIYKDSVTNKVLGVKNNVLNSKPIYEITYVKYPTHIRRQYRLSFWTDYIKDQDTILETILAYTMAADSIVINNDEYNTIGSMKNITDLNNFSDRSESGRELKNYVDFEFEGYLINKNSIFTKRSYSKLTINEEIIKK